MTNRRGSLSKHDTIIAIETAICLMILLSFFCFI